MPPEDAIRLRHIADALRSALRFVDGRRREDLATDEMLVFALVYALQTVGEAASRLGEETRALAPDVPWMDVIGMRNRLVHAYFDIDHDIVWNTVIDGAPDLLAAIEPLLKVR
jgi:uncharacterized protein with HEPN domain